jgi:hypothetical protein
MFSETVRFNVDPFDESLMLTCGKTGVYCIFQTNDILHLPLQCNFISQLLHFTEVFSNTIGSTDTAETAIATPILHIYPQEQLKS